MQRVNKITYKRCLNKQVIRTRTNYFYIGQKICTANTKATGKILNSKHENGNIFLKTIKIKAQEQ